MQRSEDKLAETLASMESMDQSLAAQTKRTEDLQSQLQLSQDRVAEAQAAAAAAEADIKLAEQKMAELTDSLDSARVNHDQVVAELQQQHADQAQVGLWLFLIMVQCIEVHLGSTCGRFKVYKHMSEVALIRCSWRRSSNVVSVSLQVAASCIQYRLVSVCLT